MSKHAENRKNSQKASVGIRDVARHANVSTATVSRALNKPERVSADLRDRIARVISEIGYIPDASARALSSRRTRTIGAIVPTIDNAMFAQGIQALQGYLATQDYLLLLATNQYDLETELKQARNLIERGVDALILRGDERHAELRRLLAAKAIPFVNVGVYEPHKPYPSIGTDNAEAGRVLARYVTGLGHRRIAVVAAHQRNNDRAQARLRGVIDGLAESGTTLRPEWLLHVEYTLDDAGNAARALLFDKDRPTAVICGNDVIAYGVMLAAMRQGIRVPDQLSIVGFDDLEWSRHLQPSLTTIHMPTNEIWVRAGKYLVDLLAGLSPLKHQKVDFSLIVRESTAPFSE
ncbi:LacI family DNA-binding transcriptional regulator [uncultured Paracoccus sp.]|uniref:LacI family DNA-binding transcriptional regulator n=1 Tax=uncultured Paracoccus sp. TaxID=189685 RepID=UPI0025D4563F|nr:LacI family DNA-binding transcriptional regulator [uncultured Paracoccus sp.]